MKEGLIQFFSVVGFTATIIGCIYGIGKLGEFACEISTRVRLLEEDIKKLREQVLFKKSEEK